MERQGQVAKGLLPGAGTGRRWPPRPGCGFPPLHRRPLPRIVPPRTYRPYKARILLCLQEGRQRTANGGALLLELPASRRTKKTPRRGPSVGIGDSMTPHACPTPTAGSIGVVGDGAVWTSEERPSSQLKGKRDRSGDAIDIAEGKEEQRAATTPAQNTRPKHPPHGGSQPTSST